MSAKGEAEAIHFDGLKRHCGELLRHGIVLNADQANALRDGNPQRFVLATQSDDIDDQTERRRVVENSPHLPMRGTWEYRVVPMTEFLGLATAKGTAGRMEIALNDLAIQGWELVATSERDSRWLGGETVLLTLRRFVVTEHMLAERFRAEERIRRQVVAELDTDRIA